MRYTTLFTSSILLAALSVFAAKQKEPVIRKEMRGKTEYMFINGIKVHEADPKKQPQPKVVKPKPYDAEAAKPPPRARRSCDVFDHWAFAQYTKDVSTGVSFSKRATGYRFQIAVRGRALPLAVSQTLRVSDAP